MGWRLTIGAIVVVIACVFGFALYIRSLSDRADFIIRTAYELSEQEQAPTVAQLRERYGNRLKLDGCAGSDCAYTVTLSNRYLAALHLAPHTEITSHFWVRDNTVLSNMLDFTTLVEHRDRVVAHVQTDFCDTCQTFTIDPWTESSPLNTNGLVEIGNKTPASSRRTALSLNSHCLAGGDCVTVADLLPTVWRKTADSRIACTIQTDKGWVEKPAGWP